MNKARYVFLIVKALQNNLMTSFKSLAKGQSLNRPMSSSKPEVVPSPTAVERPSPPVRTPSTPNTPNSGHQEPASQGEGIHKAIVVNNYAANGEGMSLVKILGVYKHSIDMISIDTVKR